MMDKSAVRRSAAELLSCAYARRLKASPAFRNPDPLPTGPCRITTFFGETMEGRHPEIVSDKINQEGFFEVELTSFLIHYLKPGMIFFDIGAHFGYFSLLASRLVGNGGCVHAFEPTPRSFEILDRNTRHRNNIAPSQTAFWSEEIELTFRDFGDKYSAFNSFFDPRVSPQIASGLAFEEHVVKTTTVDRYVQSARVKPDMVKIDAESSEYEILLGMERTLKELRPIISLETGDINVPGAKTTRELLDHLLSKDYRPVEYSEGKIRDHQPKTEYRYDNLLFLPA